ncbi:MAG: ABC transporter ATP-binding protein [Candidatus Peregrinibacteria bacterium]|nr:ABC transporter ATP-binding protein [Candidatus Peregrinibacteria bacterium]
MLELSHVSKGFRAQDGTMVEAVQDVSMTIKEKEFVSIVGPSGCGKTTLLRMIAGLETSEASSIRFNGHPVNVPDRERGMVFQSFALFPWLNVYDNIASGLRFAGRSDEEVSKTVSRYLGLTGLEAFSKAYPMTLSGGMRQRVAIARTLANDPKVILMDEPFGSLDSQTRSQMQEFLADLWEKDSKMVIFVTHDIEEAVFLSDRVFLMSPRPGRIKKEFIIPFGVSRPRELKFSDDFFALKKEIMRLI